MQPLDDRTTCYTLIFWYFETADPTRPDPRVDPTRVQLWAKAAKRSVCCIVICLKYDTQIRHVARFTVLRVAVILLGFMHIVEF